MSDLDNNLLEYVKMFVDGSLSSLHPNIAGVFTRELERKVRYSPHICEF